MRLSRHLCVLLITVSPILCAETLQVAPPMLEQPSTDTAPAPEGYFEPRLKTPEELLALELPVKGMTMREVEAKFGIPRNIVDAVGEPPITRWLYDDFTVYFEYRHVVHAVLGGRAPATR